MPVRPKSREETPKEGSKTIARLARRKVDVQRTKRNSNFLHCSNLLAAYLRRSHALRLDGQHRAQSGERHKSHIIQMIAECEKRGRSPGERPKSREETP